ncbi:MAG: hypothetical protein ACI93T_004009, partial [Porticoccaceae bacterium]
WRARLGFPILTTLEGRRWKQLLERRLTDSARSAPSVALYQLFRGRNAFPRSARTRDVQHRAMAALMAGDFAPSCSLTTSRLKSSSGRYQFGITSAASASQFVVIMSARRTDRLPLKVTWGFGLAAAADLFAITCAVYCCSLARPTRWRGAETDPWRYARRGRSSGRRDTGRDSPSP